MAVAAIRLADNVNAVSALHEQVSRKMWHNLWPGVPVDEVPIGHVTNGIHVKSWLSPDNSFVLERYLPSRWMTNPTDQTVWEAVMQIPDEELDALARRVGAPIALGAVAHATVTGGRAPRFPAWPYLWRALPTWPLQGLPFPPREDWREGLDFGFPWGRNRFRAPVLPPLAHGSALAGFPGWRLWDGPGHADDAILLHHAEAGFLVCGDTVRNFFGGEWNPLVCDRNDERLTRALIRSLHVTAIFPGHGPILEGPGVVARLRRLPPWMP
jgi:hypothetical protein